MNHGCIPPKSQRLGRVGMQQRDSVRLDKTEDNHRNILLRCTRPNEAEALLHEWVSLADFETGLQAPY
jgi:hypothetical protein